MVIEEHARLEIILPDGQFFEIPESDILQDSLSVTSQCVNGNTFGFGCVSPAQLSVKIRIKSAEIGRYDVYGAEITLYSWFGEKPPEDNGKRGVFNVMSVTKNHDIFTISASDNICWLDNSVFKNDNSDEDFLENSIYKYFPVGILYQAADALRIIFERFTESLTGIPKGFEKGTGYENGDMIPNAYLKFSGYGIEEKEERYSRAILLYGDVQSDNVRDYISWLAEYMGGFITANKNGDYQFNLFENQFYHKPKELNFSDFQQDSLEIAGFRTNLYSAKIVTEDNFSVSEHFPKSNEKGDINVETVIKNNQFVECIYQYRITSEKENDRDLTPIPGSLLYYQCNIQIRPFSGIYHGNQYLYLGQYVKIIDEKGKEHNTVITNITWKFRGGQQIKCVGEDSRTLSQARKRTQAVRMGENMKTQMNRLDKNVTNKIDKINERISPIENSNFQGQIDSLGSRVWELEIKDFQWQIDELRGRMDELNGRIESLESGGE